MERSWLPDETAYAGPEHLDAEFVAGFDRKQGRPDPGADLDALRDHGMEGSATVVDLGAGTGQFALPAAEHFQRVVAVDVSPAMLRLLRARADDAGHANLECLEAGFLTFDLPPGSVDAAYTRHALHQLPDFWKGVALDRIARTLRPGGLLRLRDLIFDFQPADTSEVIGRWLDGSADDPEQGYTREEYVEHLRSEYSTYRWLLEPMLEATGFEILDVDYRGRTFGAYTCRRR